MILLSLRYDKDIFFTRTEKEWSFQTDEDRQWRTSTNPWPTRDDWGRGDIKLLGPTTLVVWSE